MVGISPTAAQPYRPASNKSSLFVPELPDVQVYKRYVDRTALHKAIADVEVLDETLLDDTSSRSVRRALRGASFEETRRHGKHLFLHCDSEPWLGLHFGMSGALKYYKRDESAPEYTYFRIDFENAYHLALTMPRKLGRVRLIDDPDAFIATHDLGPDALGLDVETFRTRLEGRRGMIKSALMDQSVIAGLGNIYSDEILFQAGIHPKTNVQDLDEEGQHTLFDAMQEVLEAAIACQADPEQLPVDRFLLPHRDGDEKDPYSGTPLQKITVSGRTGYYSPARQPAP